jgi:hypothetical protein
MTVSDNITTPESRPSGLNGLYNSETLKEGDN